MSLLLQPLSWPAKLKLVEICQKPLPWKKWWKQQERLLRPIEINKADLYVMLCYMPTINLIIYTNIKLALFFFLAFRVYIQPLSKLVFRLRTWCNQRLLINDTHLGFWFSTPMNGYSKSHSIYIIFPKQSTVNTYTIKNGTYSAVF